MDKLQVRLQRTIVPLFWAYIVPVTLMSSVMTQVGQPDSALFVTFAPIVSTVLMFLCGIWFISSMSDEYRRSGLKSGWTPIDTWILITGIVGVLCTFASSLAFLNRATTLAEILAWAGLLLYGYMVYLCIFGYENAYRWAEKHIAEFLKDLRLGRRAFYPVLPRGLNTFLVHVAKEGLKYWLYVAPKSKGQKEEYFAIVKAVPSAPRLFEVIYSEIEGMDIGADLTYNQLNGRVYQLPRSLARDSFEMKIYAQHNSG